MPTVAAYFMFMLAVYVLLGLQNMWPSREKPYGVVIYLHVCVFDL